MKLPRLQSEIQRRLLVNYRADPDLVARMLPEPFRPQLVHGSAVVGICLIRLGGTRLPGMPYATGLRPTENGAHRISVAWDTPEGERTGVFIPRRDSHSRATVALGGRLYPGWHHRSIFTVTETDTDLRVSFRSTDDEAYVDVHARITDQLTGSALFSDLADASRFFRTGSDGYSPSRRPGIHEGLRLVSPRWHLEPADILHAASSFYDDPHLFPTGTIALDSALAMRHLPVTWQSLPALERKSTFTPV
ncbi:DUF2071 domain-containing protein [Catellatospora methionotrophica]|uniref:DUF2071 domain-containing protein n=1 Tax=Catellatospora methionotrophica TaxID=121620 RepID=UPI0033F7813A